MGAILELGRALGLDKAWVWGPLPVAARPPAVERALASVYKWAGEWVSVRECNEARAYDLHAQSDRDSERILVCRPDNKPAAHARQEMAR